MTNPKIKVGMVGAGFIAFTILNAILSRGAVLTIVEVAPRILPRMVDEACAQIVARWLENDLGKPRILELYLNQIYFGHNRYGVEEAALYYFGKHASALSVAEAAMNVHDHSRWGPADQIGAVEAIQTVDGHQVFTWGGRWRRSTGCGATWARFFSNLICGRT